MQHSHYMLALLISLISIGCAKAPADLAAVAKAEHEAEKQAKFDRDIVEHHKSLLRFEDQAQELISLHYALLESSEKYFVAERKSLAADPASTAALAEVDKYLAIAGEARETYAALGTSSDPSVEGELRAAFVSKVTELSDMADQIEAGTAPWQ